MNRAVGSDAVRLALDPAPSALRAVDGAWWPHSDDLAVELPPLLARLATRGGVPHRVWVNHPRWASGSRRLMVEGRVIRVREFSNVDPDLIRIGRRDAAELILLIIPPDCPPEQAERAMAVAAESVDRSRPAAILAAAAIERSRPAPPTPRRESRLRCVEFVVVARRGQGGRSSPQARFGAPRGPDRIPVPPEHLYRPGSGRTLCRLVVDETWERFPALAGTLSDAACADCRAAHVPGESSALRAI